jgi:very-short-patch-repair endonuclease
LSRKQVTLEELERVLGRAKGRRGVRLLRAVVASRSGANGPTESDLERVALSVIEESRLPKPTVQRRVALGRRRARLDCSYPAQGVVVECDGYAFHSDVRAFERDRQRINALTARGVVVLRWTWAALHERPQELTDELRAVLLSRSR